MSSGSARNVVVHRWRRQDLGIYPLHQSAASGSGRDVVWLLTIGLSRVDEPHEGWLDPSHDRRPRRSLAHCQEILLSKGANVATVNCFGFTALLVAAQYGHLAVMEVLIRGRG